ncbi:MAG: hypothetical protein AB4911_03620 [Oscillochloridaceae bacterium umkhey_bin13]
MENFKQLLPRAFAALEPFPALRSAVGPSLRAQAARTYAVLAHIQLRPRLLATLEAALQQAHGGLVVLEGPPGSGVSSLIDALAARNAMPLWLVGPAGPGGPAALYAQLAARYRPNVPLLDPAVLTDPAALERLLNEAAANRPPGQMITLLIDELYPPDAPLRPGPIPLPAELPPGVSLLLGGVPDSPTPYPPVARLRLPVDDPELEAVQLRTLAQLDCPTNWQAPLVSAAGGNFLYLKLALAALREAALDLGKLPPGLDALLLAWWQRLSTNERRLAALLAAADEPLPVGLAAELLGSNPEPTIARWERLGLVDLTMQASPPPPDAPPDTPHGRPTLLAALAHRAPAHLIARISAPDLVRAHGDLANYGLRVLTARRASRSSQPSEAPADRYVERHLARHASLGPREQRDATLQTLASRERLRDHDRRAGLAAALEEVRWELRAAAEPATMRASSEALLRLVQATTMAGLIATRARTMSPDAAAEALLIGLERGGREPSLKRVLDLVEHLPDGSEKAAILRRLGEICYNSRMRSSAMRLLSRALDLEATPTSRAWRDSREALHAALATAALDLGDAEIALTIAERIEHLERRAMVETQVVRHLLAQGDHARAQRQARAILHESMGAWARAEVGVALIRAGDPLGSMLLDEISSETVLAWVQIELACDAAAISEQAALQRIMALPSQSQRDRGLAAIARALAAAGDDGGALAAAEQIAAVEVRVAALIELRLSLEGLVAMLALERATRDIGAVTGDDRAPLVGALAAALAALGRGDRALDLAESLPVGEERDRALARVAIALAQRGEHEAAITLMAQIDDEDEQAWAYDEFARLLAAAGRWDEAQTLCERIGGNEQRARAAADLAIERARSHDPVAALAQALAVDLPGERARALTIVAPELVTAGHAAQALAVAHHPDALPGAEARGRYLAAVAAALADQGQTEQAATVVASIRRPADRARAGAALARALAPATPELARAVLGATLRAATVGREEALRALELAAPALGTLGGSALLNTASATVDQIDRW